MTEIYEELRSLGDKSNYLQGTIYAHTEKIK